VKKTAIPRRSTNAIPIVRECEGRVKKPRTLFIKPIIEKRIREVNSDLV
jgi:hypothetical protein